MSLSTRRANGEAVPTPIWFARVGRCLYVRTASHFGKLKRIARNSSVTVSPCTPSGDVTGGTWRAEARALSPGEPAQEVAEAALQAKYGKDRLAMTELLEKNGWQGVYVEIRPPDNVESA